jgi:WS/DGAT/MGAT family acyltransferase
MKFHHAAIDGVTGDEVLAAMHDSAPYQADASSYRPMLSQRLDREPSPWNLIARAPLSAALSTMKLGLGITCAIKNVLRAGFSLDDLELPAVPMTILNARRVSPNRSIGGRYFDLEDFKAICKTQAGTTINDVALAVVAGALRYYLEARENLPDETLIAACPINLGSEDDARIGRGNLLSAMTPPLFTDRADPLERLRAIHEGTKEEKAFAEKLGKTTLTRIPMNLPAPVARYLYPLLFLVAGQARWMPFNTIVSNIAMIHGPFYFAGAKLVRVLATGPIVDQAGVFHAVFSFDGTLSVAFTACRDMLPDPAFYAECIGASFDELKSAALGQASHRLRQPAARKARRKSRPKKPSAKRAYSAATNAAH